jgi:hypothetical protein
MIIRHRLRDAQFEVRELVRLLEEAKLREKQILRDMGHQSWREWLWEWVFGF